MYRAIWFALLILLPISGVAEQSTCYGTTANGRLENGVKLPRRGENYQAYSFLGHMAGRTYTHSKVRDIVIAAYDALQKRMPDKVFVYGETGWPSGGRFKPHKTHQNGLSVDFMTPVTKAGRSVPLPTGISNKLGYNIEFDSSGHYADFTIDFEAMANHLVELDKAATEQNVKIWRVIFDPKLQPFLFETSRGEYLKKNIQFSKKPSWVRHDEHYHVDFIVNCKPV